MAEEKIVTVHTAAGEEVKVRCAKVDGGTDLWLYAADNELIAEFPVGSWSYYLVGDVRIPWQPPSD